jgi:hypothetical protein
MPEVSVSPSGETFPLPAPEDYATEFDRVQALAHSARAEGREIVVVMGVGFVGAVMAAIIADATDETGQPAQLLEDPPAQPRRVARQSRGPRGRPHDLPLCPRQEDAHRHL